MTNYESSFDLENHTLNQPQGFDTDWGGDGSDPERPSRAHVLAALRPSTGPYAPPLNMLLELGDVAPETLKAQAKKSGIGQQHVPELVRMVRDRSLVTAYDDNPASWAPIHALQLLQDLDVSDAVEELLAIFDTNLDLHSDQLMDTLVAVGAKALPPIIAYINDESRWVWGRSRAIELLTKIAEQHPEVREQVVALLSDILTNATKHHDLTVTDAMDGLVELKATETLPLIRRAFEQEKIDETVRGSWGDVLEELGIEAEPNDPLIEQSQQRLNKRNELMFPQSIIDSLDKRQNQTRTPQRTSAEKHQNTTRKRKNKRKTASASRKANRKKR